MIVDTETGEVFRQPLAATYNHRHSHNHSHSHVHDHYYHTSVKTKVLTIFELIIIILLFGSVSRLLLDKQPLTFQGFFDALSNVQNIDLSSNLADFEFQFAQFSFNAKPDFMLTPFEDWLRSAFYQIEGFLNFFVGIWKFLFFLIDSVLTAVSFVVNLLMFIMGY